jgi:copper chaperone CopZ
MTKSLDLKIEGMTCGHCAMSVTKELQKVAGAQDIQVDPKAGTAHLATAESVTEEALAAAVAEAGYTLTSVSSSNG